MCTAGRGVGRTGTVVGCLLREQGLTADEALGCDRPQVAVDGKAGPASESPERPEQFAFIERWPGKMPSGAE